MQFNRFYRIQIICADVPLLLTKISSAGVEVLSVEWMDAVTVQISIQRKYLNTIDKILSGSNVSWRIVGRNGKLWYTETIWKRPVLTVGLIVFFLISLIVPNRVFFIEVEGNQNISQQEVLYHAEKTGIKFGALSSDIRSESVKNQLLLCMPKLQWVGVTTRGCVAVIQIRERSEKITDSSKTNAVCNIVASSDGIITDQKIYSGNPLFQIGDVVKGGDTLVSGYIDCGIKLQTVQSQAEIFGLTIRVNLYIAPHPSAVRGAIEKKHICYKFRIGKKVINLCNHSGIMDTSCVKMYMEDYWSVPGGMQFPVSLIKVTHYYYELHEPLFDDLDASWLPQFAREFVSEQMVAGKILNESLQQKYTEEVSILTGCYACHEMIGREKYEEIMK